MYVFSFMEGVGGMIVRVLKVVNHIEEMFDKFVHHKTF